MENNSKSECEIYYSSPKKKAIIGSLLLLVILGFILTLIYAPDVEFNYLFGTVEYSHILLFASILMAIYFVNQFDGHRDSKVYLDAEGRLDISSPRDYIPLPTTFLSRIIGRANIFYQKNLQSFKYSDGRIYIENNKGSFIEAPLSELTFSYKMDNHNGMTDWYVYQYIVTDKNGYSVKFNRNHSLFNTEEYSDMEMLLSLSGVVKEGRLSKINRKMRKALSYVEDFDFSDIPNSVSTKIFDAATEELKTPVGNLAKKHIVDKFSKRKKNIFKRMLLWILGILLILYILIVIIVNVSFFFTETDFSVDPDLEELYLDGECGHLRINLKDGTGDYFSLPGEIGDPAIVEYNVINYDPKSGKLDLREIYGDSETGYIYKGVIDKEGTYSGIVTDLLGNKLKNFIYHRDQKCYEWFEKHSMEENDDVVKPYSVEYAGTIADQRVQMYLTFYPSGVVEGRYMYNKYGSWIDLTGTFTDDKIIMTERYSNGKTGTIILQKDTDDDYFRIVGHIINSKNKSYNVNLHIKGSYLDDSDEDIPDPVGDADVERVTNNLVTESKKYEDDKQVRTQDEAKDNAAMLGTVDVTEGVENLNKTRIIDQVIDEEKPVEDDKAYDMAMIEQQPVFPGGTQAMYTWLSAHINYPAVAAEEGVQGKVIVEFIVSKTGAIENVRVVRGRHPALDKEAVRVVKAMPKWNPGRNDGNPVMVTYTLPVTFKLQQ